MGGSNESKKAVETTHMRAPYLVSRMWGRIRIPRRKLHPRKDLWCLFTHDHGRGLGPDGEVERASKDLNSVNAQSLPAHSPPALLCSISPPSSLLEESTSAPMGSVACEAGLERQVDSLG
eukprot:scaffold259872_cov18-Tisochrysis_lutea.AAC.1